MVRYLKRARQRRNDKTLLISFDQLRSNFIETVENSGYKNSRYQAVVARKESITLELEKRGASEGGLERKGSEFDSQGMYQS